MYFEESYYIVVRNRLFFNFFTITDHKFVINNPNFAEPKNFNICA